MKSVSAHEYFLINALICLFYGLMMCFDIFRSMALDNENTACFEFEFVANPMTLFPVSCTSTTVQWQEMESQYEHWLWNI